MAAQQFDEQQGQRGVEDEEEGVEGAAAAARGPPSGKVSAQSSGEP